MGGKKTIVRFFNLYGTKEGVIGVSHIEEPYGSNTYPVVSIGVSLSGKIDEPEWKVHIPYENIDEVIEALKEAKEKFGLSRGHKEIHPDAATGGGE